MNNFCPEAGLQNPKCYTTKSYDFTSEEPIFDILLDVFKAELPPKMLLVNDCQGKPMYIAEQDIDLLPSPNNVKFKLILNPLGAIPTYSASLIGRTVEYDFELILSVANEVRECVTWELIKFKNAVEGLLVGIEFAIDGYDSVDIDLKGFQYLNPQAEAAIYRRSGTYRFSVTVTQYLIN